MLKVDVICGECGKKFISSIQVSPKWVLVEGVETLIFIPSDQNLIQEELYSDPHDPRVDSFVCTNCRNTTWVPEMGTIEIQENEGQRYNL